MLYFFDPRSKAPLLTYRVPKTGTFTIGLFEGEGPGTISQPGLGKVTVSSSLLEPGVAHSPLPFPSDHFKDPALVADVTVGSNRRLLTFRSERLRSNILRARYYGSFDVAVVQLDLVEGVRKSIVNLARSFVRDKCHYLWGTAGNTPGHSDGNPGGQKQSAARMHPASDNVDAKDRKLALGFRMAFQDPVGGYNTCAGRSDKCPQPADANALKDYLAKVREFQKKSGRAFADIRPDEWPGGPNNLYPRKFAFKDTFHTNAVWGESCDGKRHFDCVGLINYCYAYHWKDNIAFGLDIVQWASVDRVWVTDHWEAKDPKNPTFTSGDSSVGATVIYNSSDVMDADVVVKSKLEHIAMVYLEEGQAKIVQAEETEAGLTDTASYNAADWKQRLRLPDSFLISQRDVLPGTKA